MNVRITTTMNVNIRSGPDMVYDVKEHVKSGITFTATETHRDKNNILWYKVPAGWICGTYVTLDKSKQAANMNRANKLKSAAGESGNSGTTSASSSGEGNTTTTTTNSTTNPNSGIGNTGDVINNVTSGGTDVLLGKRIFGIPYQYLDTTDIRIGGTTTAADKELGINFAEMMSEVPILSVIPGAPMFMPDLPKDQAGGMIQQLVDKVNDIQKVPQRALDTAINSDDKELRYFAFKEDFTTFVRYFNTLCQMNAIMMGIGNEYVPGAPMTDDYKFAYFDWTKYTLSIPMARRFSPNTASWQGASATGTTSIKNELGGMADSIKAGLQKITGTGNMAQNIVDMYNTGVEPYYTDFVIKPGINYTETFGNQKKESAMAGMFNQMSEMSKELQFILNTSQLVSEETINSSKQAAYDTLSKGANMLGGSTFVNRFLKGASSVLSGTNIVFPEIWNNSTYARSFNIEIPLYTPYGSLTNIFMDILVPIWFWIAISAPHQASANSYSAPFLLKCHVPGIFNVDMGMVESLSITKGVNNEWTVDGYPLAVDLHVSIVDLYSSFYISRINGVSINDAFNMLQNNSMIDYVSVQSGINMKQAEWDKKLAVAEALAKNAFSDVFHHPSAAAKENAATAIREMTVGQKIAAGVLTKVGQLIG